ncbi:MAG: hypothetical protein V4553_04890 [Bacteroidota bacterium]
MKKLFNHLKVGLLATIAIMAVSCQREKLAEVVSTPTYGTVNASLVNKLEVGTGSTYTVTGVDVTVPATVTFSAATSRAFTLNLATNVDTVAQLITAGTLPAGTVAFPSGTAVTLPQVVVPAGVTSVSFNIIVNRSAMELSYGKNMAAVFKMSAVTKGNTIAAGKGTMIFVVKTAEILAANSIHQISFASPNKVVNLVSDPSNYSLTSTFIQVSIPIALQGDPGASFTVNAVSSPDTVTKYIGTGLLSTSVGYNDVNVGIINPVITFAAGASTAYLNFQTRINTLLAQQPAAGAPTVKYPTVAFTINNPSKYSVAKAKNTVIVVMDPNFFRPYLGKPYLVKGTVGAPSDMILCANYDFGGQGVAFNDNTTKDGDGGYRAPDFVDVVPDYTPRSVVGWTGNGEWLTFSINVEATGNYQVDTWMGASGTAGRWQVFIDNVSISGNNQMGIYAATGNNNNNQQPFTYKNGNLFTQGTTVPVPITAGYHIVKLFENNASYDMRGIVFTRLN